MRIAQQDMQIAVLASVAMAINFLWFDLPGHGGAFLERDLVVRAVLADGHTCFLVGMLAVSVVSSLAPRWLERCEGRALWVSAVAGTAALAVQYGPVAPQLAAAAAIATGFFNIHLLIVDVLLLTHVRNRKVAGTAVAGVFVLRGVCMYGANALLPASAQLALLLALPVLCAGLTFGALRCVRREGLAGAEGFDGPIFEKPLSTAMLGLLLLSAVAFALPCAVGATGFWGTPFALGEVGPAALFWGSVAFFAITYVTLVKTEASLLLRFIPGLMVLFAAYSFLYSGVGARFDLSRENLLAIEFFAEYYGEAFSWFVMVLAVRTLAMPPYRVVGLSFCANSAMTIVFQYMILRDGDAALAIVQMGFFAMLAVLVWALYHFYGISSRYRDALYVGDEPVEHGPQGETSPEVQVLESVEAVPDGAPSSVDELARLRAMAAEYGLSQRETDVFLLLAYGHSRRYICDQLFIADGTASTHISRIYEKAGVTSKQELLSRVRERAGTRE